MEWLTLRVGGRAREGSGLTVMMGGEGSGLH